MLSSERSADTGSFLLANGPWIARELKLTPEKIKDYWEVIRRFRTLFSDFTRDRFENYLNCLEDPNTFWIEVIDLLDQPVGLIYVTGLHQTIDAELHAIFFDRQLTNKVELTKLVIAFLFETFPALHRLTVSVPEIYHATVRYAKACGFRYEGKIRERFLFGGKWVNEVTLGLLASEIQNG